MKPPDEIHDSQPAKSEKKGMNNPANCPLLLGISWRFLGKNLIPGKLKNKFEQGPFPPNIYAKKNLISDLTENLSGAVFFPNATGHEFDFYCKGANFWYIFPSAV